MDRYNSHEVMQCYDLAAHEYAAAFLNELDQKPFDRSILERFSNLMPVGSTIYDFGCGPGQTTAYLHDLGRHQVIGLDFSRKAILLARQTFPAIEFVVDDMLHSNMPSESANGILAFYAIVHFTEKEVEQCLKEWLRLLRPGGFCLFSFHHGADVVEITDFLGVTGANATWRFHDADRLFEIAENAGFKIFEAVIRYPYNGVEHPSKRAYFLLEK